MALVNLYLTFNGNCEDAFNFYKGIFGVDFESFMRFEDMPPQEGFEIPDNEKQRVMHASLPISKETRLMGSDTGGEWAAGYKAGNNFSVSISADSRDDADRFFKALGEGGEVTMPMDNTFWGSYFGTVVDQFGINWMIGYDEAPHQG